MNALKVCCNDVETVMTPSRWLVKESSMFGLRSCFQQAELCTFLSRSYFRQGSMFVYLDRLLNVKWRPAGCTPVMIVTTAEWPLDIHRVPVQDGSRWGGGDRRRYIITSLFSKGFGRQTLRSEIRSRQCDAVDGSGITMCQHCWTENI